MKPQDNEIVRGYDIRERFFEEGLVKENTESHSLIELPSGESVVARHESISGQIPRYRK